MFLNISSHGKSRQVINATENNSSDGQKALPNATETSDNSITLFHLAASVGDVEKLRTCGYVDLPDAMGCTPLHYAVSAHQIAAVKYLVSCGADCNKMAANGTTPISMAKMLGDDDLVEALRGSPKSDSLDDLLYQIVGALTCKQPPSRLAKLLEKLAIAMLERDVINTPRSTLAVECLSKLKQWGGYDETRKSTGR